MSNEVEKTVIVKHSSHAGIAAVINFFIPGLGMFYQGRILAAILWFSFTVFGYFMMIIPGLVLHFLCICASFSDE